MCARVCVCVRGKPFQSVKEEREREVSVVSPSGGRDLQLSLSSGCHSERAVLHSGASNGRRRCSCHHGDGAVPREVVMG